MEQVIESQTQKMIPLFLTCLGAFLAYLENFGS